MQSGATYSFFHAEHGFAISDAQLIVKFTLQSSLAQSTIGLWSSPMHQHQTNAQALQ